MDYSQPYRQQRPSLSATSVPTAFDDYYEAPAPPNLVSPLPQRPRPEMSEQISEGLDQMNLDTNHNRQSAYSTAGPGSSNMNAPEFPKLRDPPANIPPSDDDFMTTLENARSAVLSSNDPEMQLAWAQDALQQCGINHDDRERLQQLKLERPQTPSHESQLQLDAMNIVRFLSEQHHPKAEFLRGMWFEFGRFGCPLDKKEAFRSYSHAADNGYARAEYRLGMLYESSNDPVRALKNYHKGADAGDSACLYRLGMMTLRGQHGQPQDYNRGLDLIRRSAACADENAAQGAYVYGMLLAGQLPQLRLPESILPLDERAARAEIEKAAYMKFSKAQLKMGTAYELAALGCDFNPAYSLHYYALAARQGEVDAEMGISKWFLVGHDDDFPKNEEVAYTYAQRAALSGSANAEFGMGYFNELGIHVPRNIDVALDWYRKAAKDGNADAQGRIDGISQKQVLSRKDHENIALTRIKSQYGSKRGGRPARLQQQQHGRVPSITEGQGYRPSPPPGPGQGLRRPSSNVPYPTENGPPALPPIGTQMRPTTTTPYPENGNMPHTPGNGYRGPISPHRSYGSDQRAASAVYDRPPSSMNAPDPRQRYPSGPAPGPQNSRPGTASDPYRRTPNQRHVSSPAPNQNRYANEQPPPPIPGPSHAATDLASYPPRPPHASGGPDQASFYPNPPRPAHAATDLSSYGPHAPPQQQQSQPQYDNIGFVAPLDNRRVRPMRSRPNMDGNKPLPPPGGLGRMSQPGSPGFPPTGPMSPPLPQQQGGGGFAPRTSSRPDLGTHSNSMPDFNKTGTSTGPGAGAGSGSGSGFGTPGLASPPPSKPATPASAAGGIGGGKPKVPNPGGKGPKTFEEMGVPVTKQENDCIVM